MEYRNYKGFTKIYIVVYVTGTGVMEDKFIEHDVVFETDDKDEAYAKANELEIHNNSLDDIKSTWYNNRYHVKINTLSETGNKLLNNFKSEFNDSLEQGIKEGKYNKIKVGDIRFYIDNRLSDFINK